MEALISKERMRKRTLLVSGLGGYIDAGSIIAGAVSLPVWSQTYGLSLTTIGLLGAISSNAISAGIGALIGGYLCDKYGRQKVMTNNLLLYLFGVLILISVQNVPMLFAGYILVGLAVGCDVPATWSMMSEVAKHNKRGALMQIFWSLGPIVVFALGLGLEKYGLMGTRFLFAHLFILAFFTFLGRRTITESARWSASQINSRTKSIFSQYSGLFSRIGIKSLLVCGGMYLFWNLMASTSGFFFPYLLQTFGAISPSASVLLMMFNFALTLLGTAIVYVPLCDKMNRRLLFSFGIGLQIMAYVTMVMFPLTLHTAIIIFFLNGFGGGFSAQHFFQLWSTEYFPARLRASASGLMFSVVRVTCGVWGIFIPVITSVGFRTLGITLVTFLTISWLIGLIWGTNHSGLSLEEIERDMGWHNPENTDGDLAPSLTDKHYTSYNEKA